MSIRAKNVSNMPWIVYALKRKKMARRAWVIFFFADSPFYLNAQIPIQKPQMPLSMKLLSKVLQIIVRLSLTTVFPNIVAAAIGPRQNFTK